MQEGRLFARSAMVSKVLQTKTITLCEAREAADCLKENLHHMKLDSSFDGLWDECWHLSEKLDIDEPTMPKAQWAPRR